MFKDKPFRTEVRSDDEYADIPAIVEFTIDVATAREIIRLSQFVKANGLYKVEKFDWRARYFKRSLDDSSDDSENHDDDNDVRTEADIINISDNEFWFSAYLKHTNVEILSEHQGIKDLAVHFNIDPDTSGNDPTVSTPNEQGSSSHE